MPKNFILKNTRYTPPDRLYDEVIAFLKSDKKVFLLVGPSGSGKTQFCEYLQYALSKSHQSKYIDLANITDCGKAFLTINPNETSLQNLLLLDGYGDNGQFHNLYSTQQLQHWNGKLLICCNSYHLNNYEEVTTLFAPLDGLSSKPNLLWQAEIPHFTLENAQDFVRNQFDNHEQFSAKFFEHKFSLGLTNYPLLLKMSIEIFIEQCIKNADESLENLYGQLLQRWFDYHQKKLAIHSDQFSIYLTLCKSLAQLLQKNKTSTIQFQPQSDLFDDIQDESASFFVSKNKQTKLLQMILPLHQVKKKLFTFWSPSLEKYIEDRPLVAQTTPPEIIKQSYIEQSLVSINIDNISLLKNNAVLQHLADQALTHHEFKKYLITTILSSRISKNLATAAAVAITVLNRARMSFCSLNLSDIQIPGADLSHGLFEGTCFHRANLKGVSFRKALLNKAEFDDAQMEGVEMEEWPTLYLHGGRILNVASSACNQRIATLSPYVLVHTGIVIWDANTFKMLTMIKSYDDPIGMFFHTTSHHLIYGTSKGELIEHDIQQNKVINAFNTHFKKLYQIKLILFQNRHIVALVGMKIDNQTYVVLYDYENHKEMISMNFVELADDKLSTTKEWQLQSSFDGCKFVIGIMFTRSVYLFDLELLNIRKLILDHDSPLSNSIAFSRDNAKIIFYSSNRFHYYSASNGLQLYETPDHCEFGIITALASSSTDHWIALSDSTGKIHFWDYIEKFLITSLPGNTPISFLKVFHFGTVKMLCIGEADGIIRFKNVTNIYQNKSDALTHSPAVIYLSEDNSVIAGSSDGKIRHWDFDRGICLATYDAHTLDIHALVLIREKNKFISAGADGLIIIWNLSTFTPIQKIQASLYEINCLLLSNNKETIYSAGFDGVIQQWSIETGKLLDKLHHPDANNDIKNKQAIHSLALTACHTYLMAGDSQGKMTCWDIHKNKVLSQFKLFNHSLSCITSSPNGKYIAMGSFSNTIQLNYKDNRTSCLSAHLGEISQLHFFKNNQRLISASHDGFIYIWSMQDETIELTIQGNDSGVMAINLSEDEQHLLVSRWSGCIELWKLNKKAAHLRFSIGHVLSAKNIRLHQVNDLSEPNKRLFEILNSHEEGTEEFRKKISLIYSRANKTKILPKSDSDLTTMDYNLNPDMFVQKHFKSSGFMKTHPEILFSQHLLHDGRSGIIDILPPTVDINSEMLKIILSSDETNQYIRHAIKYGANINEQTNNTRSPLDISLMKNSLYNFQYLIQHKANIELNVNLRVETAIEHGHLSILHRLKKKNVNFHQPQFYLHALLSGNLDIIVFLNQQGVDYREIPVNGEAMPVLNIATQCGHLHLVKYHVLIKKFDVNKKDSKGFAPLFVALSFLRNEIALFLLENGADPYQSNSDGFAIWMNAYYYNNTQLIEYFSAQSKINQYLQNAKFNNSSPLKMALENGFQDLSMQLFTLNQRVMHETEIESAFILAISREWAPLVDRMDKMLTYLCHSDKKIFHILQRAFEIMLKDKIKPKGKALIILMRRVKNKYFVDANSKMTFLMLCAQFGNLEALEVIYQFSIINLQCKKGLSALSYAIFQNHAHIVHFLLEKGADANLHTRKLSEPPIHNAVFGGNLSIVKDLYEHKADINEKDSDGMTPLMLAASEGYVRIVDFLLNSANANPYVIHGDSQSTAIKYAYFHGHFSIVKMFSSYRSCFNIRGEMNRTILHQLIESNALKYSPCRIRIASYLLDDLNLQIDIPMSDGTTPVLLSAKLDDVDFFKFLYNRNANKLSVTSKNDILFDAVLINRSIHVADYLIKFTSHKNNLIQFAYKKLQSLMEYVNEKRPIGNKFLIKKCVSTFYVLCEVDRNNPELPDKLGTLIEILNAFQMTQQATKFKEYLSIVKQSQSSNRIHQSSVSGFFSSSNRSQISDVMNSSSAIHSAIIS